MITPDDDPLWLACEAGVDPVAACSDYRQFSWCTHVEESVKNGEDELVAGVRVCVPLVPWKQVYAEVALDPSETPYTMGFLSVTKGNDEELIALSMYSLNSGGRYMIAEDIGRWTGTQDTRALITEAGLLKCPARGHSWKSEQANDREKRNMEAGHVAFMQISCLLLYRMCYGCYKLSLSVRSAASNNFGVDPASVGVTAAPRNQGSRGIELNTSGFNQPRTSNQAAARERLNQMFGQPNA